MHRYRRQAKYAAWYDDRDDNAASRIKNPFAKWQAAVASPMRDLESGDGDVGELRRTATGDRHDYGDRAFIPNVYFQPSPRPMATAYVRGINHTQPASESQSHTIFVSEVRMDSDQTQPGTEKGKERNDLLAGTTTVGSARQASLKATQATYASCGDIPPTWSSPSSSSSSSTPGLSDLLEQSSRVVHTPLHTSPEKARFEAWVERKPNHWASTRKAVIRGPEQSADKSGISFAFGFERCQSSLAESENTSASASAARDGLDSSESFHVDADTDTRTIDTDTSGKPARCSVYLQHRRIAPGPDDQAPNTVGEHRTHNSKMVLVIREDHGESDIGAIREKASRRHRDWHERIIQSMGIVGESESESRRDLVCFLATRAVIYSMIHEVLESWEDEATKLEEGLETLRRRVYASPDDDGPSGDLWKLSKQAVEMGQSIEQQVIAMEGVENCLAAYGRYVDVDRLPSPELVPSLSVLISELRNLRSDLQNDLTKPIESMIDLMYKSISIRDSRLSLELNASLWRLSWITFILLPLIFLAGIFGMNVDLFRHDPASKWYFISAAVLMVVVLVSWFAFRKFQSRNLPRTLRLQTPSQLGLSSSRGMRLPRPGNLLKIKKFFRNLNLLLVPARTVRVGVYRRRV
ncbi:hypothetical protein A1O3_09371 [Capronia epimyces CBS 606.96]|uniref:Magnesium transporter n=1 Tax=Capronia epimyces CBS 606.96 TaxID=1182542 RepID=W9XLJ7_9EURO|nr:uncharacterized protein A1O3_09371 [Capronia epimyces CBS 606.96]EXJ78210.1 hypothetical protein A1O3_09371 [Capronia epimyces CBS 606.96]